MFFINIARKMYHRGFNRLFPRKCCYLCGEKFRFFGKYRGGNKNIWTHLKALRLNDSDMDNFNCLFCGATDRERHLVMFFDRLKLWERMKDAKVLHIAPEKQFKKRIETAVPAQYIQGDLLHCGGGIEKLDATNIHYPSDTFDFVFCNHVLEHIPDDTKAMTEIFRVIKKGGIAVLQVPVSAVLKLNFSDPGINTDALRLAVYGQEDHVRIYGQQYFNQLRCAGFTVQRLTHAEYLTDILASYYGVNPDESMILCRKPD